MALSKASDIASTMNDAKAATMERPTKNRGGRMPKKAAASNDPATHDANAVSTIASTEAPLIKR